MSDKQRITRARCWVGQLANHLPAMSLAEHKKDGWTNQQPVAGAAAAAAYTGGQAEFTKALLASEHAYAWQCNACGFHAFALPGDEASKLKRWRNVRDLMCKHDRK